MYLVIAQKVPTLTSSQYKAKARRHIFVCSVRACKWRRPFNSLNREMHAHKQVYMSSAIKGKKASPPFLQCIDAYTGVSEANTVSGFGTY